MGMLSYLVLPVTASAAELTTESVAMINPTTGATTTYTITVGNVTSSVVGCVSLAFTTTVGGLTLPTNMGILAANLTPSGTLIGAGDGEVDLNGYTYQITDSTPVNPGAGTHTIVLTGVTNSSVANTTYYVSVNTFSDAGCATPVDTNGIGTFVNTAGVLVDATVNPTLTFTVGSTTCGLGVLTSGTTGTCNHPMTAATNGTGGYAISYISTSTLTSGVPTISPLSAGGTSTTNTEQFGLHLTVSGGSGAVAVPYQAPTYKFVPTSVEQVASSTGASALSTYTVTYIANITDTTEAGIYTMTQTYNITATY
jgi:hypothetical protein